MAGSIAEGISLQGKAPDYTREFMRQQEMLNRQRAAKAKGQKDALDKYEKDILVDKNLYHPILIADQKRDAAETWDKVLKAYQDDPDHFSHRATETLIDFNGRTAMRAEKSKNYWEAEKQDSGNLTPEGAELQQRMRQYYGRGEEAFVQGTQDIAKKSLGYASVTPEGGITLRERPKDTNVSGRVMKMYEDLAATVDPTIKEGGILGNQQIVEILRQTPDNVKKQALAAYFQNNPGEIETYRYVNKDKILSGQLPDDPNAIMQAAVNDLSQLPSRQSTVQLKTIPEGTQTERGKQWKRTGTTYQNAENAWTMNTPERDATFVKMVTNNVRPENEKYKNLFLDKDTRVFDINHVGKGQTGEDKVLDFVDDNKKAVTGEPQRIYFNPRTKEGVIVVAIEKKSQTVSSVNDANVRTSETGKTAHTWALVPYSGANYNKIKDKYGNTAEQVFKELGGDAGSVTDEKIRSQSQSSGGSSRTIVKKQWNKGQNKTKFIYSDGSEEIVDGIQ